VVILLEVSLILGWGGTSLKAKAFKLVPPHPRRYVRWGEVSFKPQGLKLTSPHLTLILIFLGGDIASSNIPSQEDKKICEVGGG